MNEMNEKKLQNKIEELEEEVKKLKDQQKDEDIAGVAQGALQGLGKIIPGLGDLVKGLEKSEAFQERLKTANNEVERQLKKAPPLKKVQESRRSIIPPMTTLKVSRNTLKEEATPAQREMVVDVFDEGDHLKIITELPGVNEKDIKAELKNNRLIISTQATSREYYKEVELPCEVKNNLNLSYKNGILQITIEK